MGKTRRFALTLGLTTALCLDAGLAFADPADEAATENGPGASDNAASRGGSSDDPEERLAKRRERLQQGAKRLRERAAEMKQKAAAGETPKASPNAKRQPRSYADQAQRLEEQANKMEERAKNLDATDGASRRGDKAATSRQRRHQTRRIQLNRRWGDALKDPKAVAELKLHAERTARLKRIRAVAIKKSKDDPAAERASKLLAKEVARHEVVMKEIQAKTVAADISGAQSGSPAAEEPGK